MKRFLLSFPFPMPAESEKCHLFFISAGYIAFEARIALVHFTQEHIKPETLR